MAHYRYYYGTLQVLYVNDWIKMLDVRIQRKSPPHNIQFGFIRFWREPQLLFFVNIPSIILRPDKYKKLGEDPRAKNKSHNKILQKSFNFDFFTNVYLTSESM